MVSPSVLLRTGLSNHHPESFGEAQERHVEACAELSRRRQRLAYAGLLTVVMLQSGGTRITLRFIQATAV